MTEKDNTQKLNKNKTSSQTLLKQLENLSPEKRSLLTSRLKSKNSSQSLQSTIIAQQKIGPILISLTQEWWWLLEQLQPNSAAFNQSCSVRFTGQLNISILEKSINEVIARHENLRTTFVVIDGYPYQNIAESLYVNLPIVKLVKEPDKEIDITIKQLITKEVSKPFDLSRLPLLRACLLKISNTDHILVITNHHLILDGWSAGILAKEISTIYQAFYQGKPSPLPALSIQYADFAIWQRQYLQGEVLENKLSYWKQKLANASASLDLPTDYPYPLKQSFAGRRSSFFIPNDAKEKLKNISQLQEATPFMGFLAVFKVLLYRYCQQKDIVVGTPVANRTLEEVKPLIGLFANNLPLHTTLVGNPSFNEFLAQVNKVCLEAYKHQDLPFNNLLSQVQTHRINGRSALFQTVFLYQSALISRLSQHSDFSISMFSGPREEATMTIVDLSFEMSEFGFANFIYRKDLFDLTTIERMKNHFLNLLSAIVSNPNQPILELSLMTDAERYTIVTQWNKTNFAYPENLCIHEIFSQQVLKTPKNVAVAYQEERVSYLELEQKSNQLAHYLQGLGVGVEDFVGVYLERSTKLIITLLGILKAGAAYLPLDPSYPKDRLGYIIIDSKAPIVITSEDLIVNLPNDNARIICLERDAKAIAAQSVSAPVSRVYPDNLAYAIYTSGSTGLPKGTLLAHRGLCSLISTQIAHFQINSSSRLLQTLSISGDASLWEIFAAILSGATLYLADKDQTLPGQELIDLLNKNQITVLCPAIRALSAVPEGEIPSLETILAGGETCPPELVARWAKNHNLYNCYGPTEATVCTTYFKCDVNMSRTPPIGKPFANAKVYILDKYLQPVPIGVVGEMYISGITLARGYLNRAELTAEKFIPDPFSSTPSQRMYRTGDLAKYLVDGNIQFLGRADHQIKIRGFRIELDEIEEVIFSHPDVTEAVVIAEEVTPGDKQILAYVVVNTEVTESSLVDELRSLLKLKLPPFMIPSEIIVLDVFPRLLSGKVDRRSLPIPTSFSHEVSSLPITETEKAIASIWKDLLKKEAIDRNDDFFDLGGHSMLMVELASQLKSVLKVNVSLRSLFESSSLSKMASAIDEVLAKNSNKSDVDDATKGVNIDKRFFEEAAKSLTKIEHRELLPLFISGEIPKVDAVAIDYLPITFLSDTSLSREQLFSTWFNNKPIISEIREGLLGRLATIMLPRFDLELHANKDSLIKLLVEGLEIAKQIGAKVVSLTGLIPSATNYGQTIVEEIKDKELPAITTGHAVTTASVIMSIEKILKESGRDIRKERVIFLGLGSIGLTTLRLMLKCLPSPESITLCDIYSKVAMLKELKEQMKEKWGFENEVNIVESSKLLPQEIYNGSLIIGATNVDNLIEVSKLKAGTMIVDDSAPHCFDTKLALKRFNQYSDILFTEGGTLESPKAMTRTIYLPSQASELIDISMLRAMIRMNPSEIPSSNFSSLLSAFSKNFLPTVGLVDADAALLHYQALDSLGFKAASLNTMGLALDPIGIGNFRDKFS